MLAQLKRAGIAIADIHHLFVTHSHTDHVLGVIWVVRMVAQCKGYEGKLHVYGNDKVMRVIRTIIDMILAKKQLAKVEERVVFHELTDGESFDVGDNGGTVTVEGSREPAIGIMMIGSFEDHSTVLKVPRSYTGTLDIDLMGGNVDAADLDRLGSVTAKTASGNISLSRLAADDIVTNAASGNVQVQRVQCAYLSATTMSGNIEFSDVEATEIVKLDTTSGGQLLRGVSTATLDARMGSGDILAAGVAATDAKFDAASGSVNASFSGSDGEYAIEASSVSGDVHSPAGSATASRHVSARTMSGDVTLTFSGGGASVSNGNGARSDSGAPTAPEAPEAPEAPKL